MWPTLIFYCDNITPLPFFQQLILHGSTSSDLGLRIGFHVKRPYDKWAQMYTFSSTPTSCRIWNMQLECEVYHQIKNHAHSFSLLIFKAHLVILFIIRVKIFSLLLILKNSTCLSIMLKIEARFVNQKFEHVVWSILNTCYLVFIFKPRPYYIETPHHSNACVHFRWVTNTLP